MNRLDVSLKPPPVNFVEGKNSLTTNHFCMFLDCFQLVPVNAYTFFNFDCGFAGFYFRLNEWFLVLHHFVIWGIFDAEALKKSRHKNPPYYIHPQRTTPPQGQMRNSVSALARQTSMRTTTGLTTTAKYDQASSCRTAASSAHSCTYRFALARTSPLPSEPAPDSSRILVRHTG